MSLETNLKGRLHNTPLPLTCGLMPLFEAIVNSIHSIEDRGNLASDGRITVTIQRRPKQGMMSLDGNRRKGPEAKEDITGFRITDNGIGFNDTNMRSFKTLDSDHKLSKGGRGVGRLLWLKAFKHVAIESVYQATLEQRQRREFRFDATIGVSPPKQFDVDSDTKIETTVTLSDFSARYRDNTRKTLKSISEAVIEHCLWYFLRPGGCPEVVIEDDGEHVALADLFEERMHSSAFNEPIEIKGQRFELVHAKLRSNSLAAHSIALCADQRLVIEERIAGKIPGLHGRLCDDEGEFVYSCYVSSTFLDHNARPERTGFDIMDSVDELFTATEISLGDIRAAVIERAGAYLANYLVANLTKAKQRVSEYVSHRAPRYRPILARIPEGQLNVDPEISDKDLDLALHKHLASLESELLAEGHDIVTASPCDSFPEYEARLRAYLAKAEDIKKSDLASYVSHRRVILDLFEKSIQRTADGRYVKEELIHQLIMPMGVDSSTAAHNSGNLWLIDERLAFHDYLASDKTLLSAPITGSTETKEPDLMVLNVFDQPILISETTKLPPASLEIVEIKRPMRNDASTGEEDDPIEQAIGYLNRIRSGGVLTATGRPIPESANVPGFCYVLADLTPKLIARCEMHDLTRTSDGLGYFGYKKNAKAYVEVIGFDRLLRMATERNRAFFDKLGLPAT